MIIAITGSTGFIGSNLAIEFMSQGHKVVHFDRSEEKVRSFFGKNADYVSISESSESLRNSFEHHSPNIVIHCSTFFTPVRNLNILDQILEANLAAPMRVFGAAKEVVSTFINLNSYWQIEDSTNRSTPYAATKETFRSYIQLTNTSNDTKIKDIFMPETFGPGDNRGKVTQKIIQSRLAGRELELLSPERKIDLAYVPWFTADLAQMLFSDQELPREFAYINFPSISVRELDWCIKQVLNGDEVDLVSKPNFDSQRPTTYESLQKRSPQVIGLIRSIALGSALMETTKSYSKLS